MDVTTTILLGAIGSLLAAELFAYGEMIALFLIRKAVKKLPEDIQGRYEEEWLADLAEFPGNLTKITRAAGMYFIAASKIGVASKPSKRSITIKVKGALAQYRAFIDSFVFTSMFRVIKYVSPNFYATSSKKILAATSIIIVSALTIFINLGVCFILLDNIFGIFRQALNLPTGFDALFRGSLLFFIFSIMTCIYCIFKLTLLVKRERAKK